MQPVQDLTEKIAASILVVDGEDLAGLAQIHEELKQLPAALAVDETVAGRRGAAEQVVGAAMTLVEKIILREVKDASAALISVSQEIGKLQELISGIVAQPIVPQVVVNTTEPVVEEVGGAAGEVRADDLPMIAEFIAEANGHLEAAEGHLLELGGDATNKECIDAIFRGFHTIKGVAGFLNLQQIAKLTHAAENLLDLARQEKLTLDGARLDVCLEAVDATKAMISQLTETVKTGVLPPPYPPLMEVIGRIQGSISGGSGKGSGTSQGGKGDEKGTLLDGKVPVSEGVRTGNGGPSAGVGQAAVAAAAASGQASGGASAAGGHGPGGSGAARQDATVKVTTERLDALINMVGELVIAEAMVTQAIAPSFRTNQRLARNAAHLGKITRELQDLTMSMRMVPIQGVFQKMSRLVRDLAKKFGKDIDLVLTGGETELDRNLVEALADPLVHMVRNSADHGLETPEERALAGKPEVGRIELKAYHQAGNIVVDIVDDGRGLNKEKILAKARKAGIIKEDAQLSEQEIFKLIFHAGLSTAEKVTDVSGRGVGMDVVRRNVESLRGRIDIQSVEGKGSTFSIRLPLTLAVIDGLIAQVGTEKYILPITSVVQSLRPKADVISTVKNRAEICTIRGEVLPLYRLHRLFGVKPRTEDPCEALIVIVQDNERRCCLLVDELLGQQQVVIKSLDQSTGSVPGVSGGAILGDGTISLILDVPGLMDLVAKSGEKHVKEQA